MAKLTGTASVRGPRGRGSTRAPGPTASRWSVCTPGPAGTLTWATGRRARGTGWAWRPKAGGCTGESGPMASKGGTGSARASLHRPGMREPGATGCRTATASRPTGMEVPTKGNGWEA